MTESRYMLRDEVLRRLYSQGNIPHIDKRYTIRPVSCPKSMRSGKKPKS